MRRTLLCFACFACWLTGCEDGGGAGNAKTGGSAGSGAAHAGGSTSGETGGSGGEASAPGVGGSGPSSGGVASGSAPGTGGTGGMSAGGGRIGDDVTVSVDGRAILVNGAPLHMRGVCWNPVGKGKTHPADLDYAGFAPRDIPLMQAIGINVVRTYEPITDRSVLDQLQNAGIFLLNTVYPYGGAAADAAVPLVEAVKNHPAILMWVIGNEWNYNGLYVDLPLNESIARIGEVARLIRASDGTRPIASVYGELPSRETLESLSGVDVWGINAYRNISFGNLFSDWAALSDKPMFLAEYGADAWNADTSSYDPESQAHATTVLTGLLVENSVLHGGVSSGGTLFEWADEWWKAGNVDSQESGGVAPGGGPYPDNVFNEEWWGIVDIDRAPRAAYHALGEVFAELGPTPGTEPASPR